MSTTGPELPGIGAAGQPEEGGRLEPGSDLLSAGALSPAGWEALLAGAAALKSEWLAVRR